MEGVSLEEIARLSYTHRYISLEEDSSRGWGVLDSVFGIKNKLTNIPSEKKRQAGGNHLRMFRDTWGLFGKEA